MNCAHCGHKNPTSNRFCGGCGATLEKPCPSCAHANPADHRFCGQCGAAIDAATTGLPDSAAGDPRVYTPDHIADRIRGSRAAVEGERKQVTVLFADVKGSMDLAEQVSSEQWHGLLDRFFTILAAGVHRFEGTVNQYTGDGIMALFGAPIAHEDHAQRACYAALHLRDELRRYADELRVERGLSFSTRIGINSGEVVVGKIGDDLRMDYTAQGHTVGLAQRMEQLAEPGQAYLTEHTAALVRGYFELRDLGPTSVKGSARPLAVYVLEGMGAARSRLDVSHARGLAKFVGRGDEMALLEAALERSLTNRGQTVGVVAEAGTGKSRLCWEFLERCRARGFPVIEGRAVAHGKHVPMLPILELLRGFFGATVEDTHLAVREKIAGRLLLLDDSLRDDLPLFFDLLGVADPAKPAPPLDPVVVQRRLFAAIRAIVKADGTREKPALVFVEDLHWIDATSDAFLAQLVEAIGTARGLVLVNFRPGYRADWMNGPAYQQLPLVPLGPAAIEELLQDLLGDHETVAGLPALVSERAAGNPFFIEEIVQSLVETGALEGRRGAYRLVRPATELAVPATVQALLAARIDRLAENVKTLLQQASVIGKTFEERVLRRISGLSDADFEAALRTLCDAEFLFEAALYPHVEYAFKHPLTQEVADRSQLATSKAVAHAAVARAIEMYSAERLDEDSALLAHHWQQAGKPASAARWHARAARWIGHNDYSQAHEHWRQVIDLTEKLDCDSELDALRTDAFHRLLVLAFRCPSSATEERVLFERAQAQLERNEGDDDSSLAIFYSAYAGLRQNAGAVDEYLEHASAAVAIADRVGDAALRAAARVDDFYALFLKGRFEESLRTADEIVQIVGNDVALGADVLGFSPYVMYFILSPWPLVHVGRIEEAERRARHGVATAARCGPDESRSWAYGLLLWVLHAKGESEGAAAAARLGLEAAERSGSPQAMIGALSWSGLAHTLAGDFESGISQALAAEQWWRDYGVFTDTLPFIYLILAEARLGAGDAAAAINTAREAREVAHGQGQPLPALQASIHEARGLIALNGAARRRDIEKLLDDAAAEVERLGAHASTPHIEEARGLLAQAAGDYASAREHLENAQRLYERTGAVGHAARVRKLIATCEDGATRKGTKV